MPEIEADLIGFKSASTTIVKTGLRELIWSISGIPVNRGSFATLPNIRVATLIFPKHITGESIKVVTLIQKLNEID